MNLTDVLNWRYATKKFSNKKIAETDVKEIIQAINLSASSTGIQPYRVFNIKDQSIREQLNEVSFNSQIAESSHLIAFAAFDSISKDIIDKFIQFTAETRGVPADALKEYQGMMEGFLLNLSDDEAFNWSAKQAYIGLGTALIAAANLKIDSTPMEGFNAPKLDELLNLKEQGLKSVVLLSLGYRDAENDFLANAKKVRLPFNEFSKTV